MIVPNVLVSDPDDVAHELADGVLEACDWPHHFGNRVNLGKKQEVTNWVADKLGYLISVL